jgi:hypothetical protein
MFGVKVEILTHLFLLFLNETFFAFLINKNIRLKYNFSIPYTPTLPTQKNTTFAQLLHSKKEKKNGKNI